MNDFAYVIQ